MKDPQENESDLARRVLTELADMAEHASMTGSLRGGEKSAAQAYNRVLASLDASGELPEGMFESLEVESADFGEIGVQCRLLLAVLRKEESESRQKGLESVVALAPFLDAADLAAMVRERIDESSPIPDRVLTALAPFLDSADLGVLVRRRMQPPAPPRTPEPPPSSGLTFDAPGKTKIAQLEGKIALIRDLASGEDDPVRRQELLRGADEIEDRMHQYKSLLAKRDPSSTSAALESP